MTRLQRNSGIKPEPVTVAHIPGALLLEAKEIVMKNPQAETLFMLSGAYRGQVCTVTGIHSITDGVRGNANSVQVHDARAANRQLDRARAGRTDTHIGTAHSHLPHHAQGPSEQDIRNMRKYGAQSIHFIFQNRGNGTMGFQARNANGERVAVAVHTQDGVRWDAPNAPHWRLEEDGRISDITLGTAA